MERTIESKSGEYVRMTPSVQGPEWVTFYLRKRDTEVVVDVRISDIKSVIAAHEADLAM